MHTSYVFIVLALIAVIVVFRTATVVPQQSAYVVENLGKYSRTLQAGFHILCKIYRCCILKVAGAFSYSTIVHPQDGKTFPGKIISDDGKWFVVKKGFIPILLSTACNQNNSRICICFCRMIDGI